MYHKFTFPLSGKNSFTYKDRDPFRVLLYNNGISTRFIVSPQLSWILEGNTCPICNPPEKTKETNENLKSFVDDYSKKFTKGIAKRAVELTLLRQGINTQPKRVAQAEKYISQYIKEKKINLEELAKQYNLKPIHTHINPDKQPYFEVKP